MNVCIDLSVQLVKMGWKHIACLLFIQYIYIQIIIPHLSMHTQTNVRVHLLCIFFMGL